MASPSVLIQPGNDFWSELQASRVYARTHSLRFSNGQRRRAASFSSEAAFFETSSFASSLTLLGSRASTHPSSQSTIFVAAPTAPSAAEYSVDAAMYSFRPPSSYSLSPPSSDIPPGNVPSYLRNVYRSGLHTLPLPLGRPLPPANPPAARPNNLHFSAQRARPRSCLQPLTLVEIHNRLSLLEACQCGDTERVTELLEQGVDPNTREFSSSLQQHGAAAIHLATMNGHYDVIRSLLHHGARVDEPFRGFRRPLHEAVRRGDSALTILLLDNGAAVEARDERGYQPLHVAVMANELACAKLLVWAGAPVNTVGNDFLTLLHHIAMRNGNMDLVELLIEHGADVLVRTRWLLGNRLASEIAREKGYRQMQARLSAIETTI